jgi:hypothetical protein
LQLYKKNKIRSQREQLHLANTLNKRTKPLHRQEINCFDSTEQEKCKEESGEILTYTGSMKDKLPPVRHVIILGQLYRIELSKDISDDELGRCETTHQKIFINERQGACSMRDTVLHEVGHALFYLMNLKDDCTEEDFVSRFSTGLRSVMLENKVLSEWIFSSPYDE